ncbi:MAG: hypothetical protein E4G89_00355 [Methanothrix sp.]|nr:MAG: hypothetical protein E4G89_00355 [Methanothrix sp.]
MAKALTTVDDAVKRAAMQFNRASSTDSLKWASEREHVKSIIAKSKKLRECLPITVYQSILQAASMGLTLNPAIQHCYLIPRRSGKDGPLICYPAPSYRGLSHICMGSGQIIQIRAEVVFQADKFRYLGPVEKPIHEPVLTDTHRKQDFCIGAYAICEYSNGSYSAEYVDRTTIETIRGMSEVQNSLMYTKFWTEGFKKIAIRRLCKTIAISSPRLAVATSVLDQHEGITFDPHDGNTIEGEVVTEAPPLITVDHATIIRDLCEESGLRTEKFCETYGVNSISELPLHLFDAAKARIESFKSKASA